MHLLEAIKEKYEYIDPNQTFDDPLDFIHTIGSPIDVLLYYELLFPKFTKIDECVFLESNLQGFNAKIRAQQCIENYKCGKVSLDQFEKDVASFNFYEVAYVFNDLDCSAEALDLLADCMAKSWQLKLESEFPQYTFKVVVEPDEDKPGPDVCIYQNLDHIKKS